MIFQVCSSELIEIQLCVILRLYQGHHLLVMFLLWCLHVMFSGIIETTLASRIQLMSKSCIAQ